MPLLNIVEKDQATGQVAEIYENMTNTLGFIPNAFKVFSPSAHVLNNQVGNLGYFMRHKILGGKLLAFIRLLVSVQENCTYCVGVNSRILMQYGVLPDMIAGIKRDPSTAPLEPKDLAMLIFVLKMVSNSNSIEKIDVDRLRDLGWNDTEILEASYHAAASVASDMIFNAFKIELDM
jgi:uncharacterized peroxidase-related enzyme